MLLKESPSKYIGRDVKLKRSGKMVEINLYAVGDGPHFKGVWVGPDGKPWQTIVPFTDVEENLV